MKVDAIWVAVSTSEVWEAESGKGNETISHCCESFVKLSFSKEISTTTFFLGGLLILWLIFLHFLFYSAIIVR
jgi:hypothetical protein